MLPPRVPRAGKAHNLWPVVIGLAVIGVASIALLNGQDPFELEGKRGRLAGEDELIRSAHNAHRTISNMIHVFGDPKHPSQQSESLVKEAKSTLREVQRLEDDGAADGADDDDSASQSGDSEEVKRSARHLGLTTNSDIQLSSVLSLQDDSAVRDELHKLRETAMRVRQEMKEMKADSAARVMRASRRVDRDVSSLDRAHNVESKARQRIVAHELRVQREKLAQAEAEERAAVRAATAAIRAEKLAREDHHKAAAEREDAERRREAARRARDIAEVGAGDVGALDKFAAQHSLSPSDSTDVAPAWLSRECTDAISQLGCSSLPKLSTCLRFCNGVSSTSDATSSETETSQHTASASGIRTEVFKGGKQGNTYIESVYGSAYDPSVYQHKRVGFFTSEPESDSQRAMYGRALARMQYTRGNDVESNGHDFEQVAKVSEFTMDPEAVLSREHALEGKLRHALAEERAKNKRLQAALRGYGGPSFGKTPPLPRYRGMTLQNLAQVSRVRMGALHKGAESDMQANSKGGQLHDAVASESSFFDPFRP